MPPSDEMSAPDSSQSRLKALRSTGLPDTPPDEGLDRLTRLTAKALRVPTALITLVSGTDADRLAFKSAFGLTEPWGSRREAPSSHSFCPSVVESGAPFVVDDARAHPTLQASPAIEALGVVAYAGVPLVDREGSIFGVLCAIDAAPRAWTDGDIDVLRDLAVLVMRELERRALEREVVALALVDDLTGLHNRRGLLVLGEQLLRVAVRTKRPAALLYVDVRGTKRINDDHGHGEGDRALRDTATILRGTCRDSDVVCRIDGDEFVVLAAAADAEGAFVLGRRLRAALATHNTSNERPYKLAFNVGTTLFDPDAPRPLADLVEHAALVMDEQRRGGQPPR
jgi:diguanylate cyclase (GGDEF)-like protein